MRPSRHRPQGVEPGQGEPLIPLGSLKENELPVGGGVQAEATDSGWEGLAGKGSVQPRRARPDARSLPEEERQQWSRPKIKPGTGSLLPATPSLPALPWGQSYPNRLQNWSGGVSLNHGSLSGGAVLKSAASQGALPSEPQPGCGWLLRGTRQRSAERPALVLLAVWP